MLLMNHINLWACKIPLGSVGTPIGDSESCLPPAVDFICYIYIRCLGVESYHSTESLAAMPFLSYFLDGHISSLIGNQ